MYTFYHTLPLHDALPSYQRRERAGRVGCVVRGACRIGPTAVGRINLHRPLELRGVDDVDDIGLVVGLAPVVIARDGDIVGRPRPGHEQMRAVRARRRPAHPLDAADRSDPSRPRGGGAAGGGGTHVKTERAGFTPPTRLVLP